MSLLEFVKMQAKVGQGHAVGRYYKWLAKNGRSFKVVNVKDSKRLGRMGQVKNCYGNSWRAMDFAGKKFRYFEGYFIKANLPIPIEHAFLVNELDQVVDPTMGMRPSDVKAGMRKYVKAGLSNGSFKPYDFGDEYFGVEIPKKWIDAELLRVQMFNGVALSYFLHLKDQEGGEMNEL